jgi:hypothetical protein
MSILTYVPPDKAAREHENPPEVRLELLGPKKRRPLAVVGEGTVYAQADTMVELLPWLTLYAVEVDRLRSS